MVKTINLVYVLTYNTTMCDTSAIEFYSETELSVLTIFKDSFVFREYSVREYKSNSITQWAY